MTNMTDPGMIIAILNAIIIFYALGAAMLVLNGLVHGTVTGIRDAFRSPDAPPPSWRTRLVFVIVGVVFLLALPLLVFLLTAAAS